MDGHELAEVAGAVGIFAFITTVITVIILQVGATVRARAVLAREDEYRKLAEAAATARQDTDRRLTEIDGRLASLDERMRSLDRVLRTVE
ncbi:hypothetical protein [Actinocorallia populi]|uniref:hypothetical protein n=1 Tax=Actinocorallia populi TaxID=2079200 RepID=UPI000D08FEF6|nr:hypothetical protein [Actinocorallia populi]